MIKKKTLSMMALGACACLGIAAVVFFTRHNTPEETPAPPKVYRVVDYPTQNYDREKVNEVRAVVLHHTALPTIERSLEVLTLPVNKVSSHCLIDTDGTRYILCAPEVVAFHAGLSLLNGREKCNDFTIGVEFQGNTVETPLTDDQIASGVEYLVPIMREYGIPIDSVVTHEMVRTNFMNKYPERNIKDKCDITPTEYLRVMEALKTAMASE